MKSVIFSIILFLILIGLLITNSIYIHKTCDKMLDILDFLSLNDIDGADEISAIWQKNRTLFSISIHDSHIERVNELTEGLKSAIAKSDGAEFNEHVALLSQLLKELKEIEEISFEGVV